MSRTKSTEAQRFYYTNEQQNILDHVRQDVRAKLERALRRARCTGEVSSFVKSEAEVDAKLASAATNSFNEPLETLSDFDDLLFFRVLLSSEEAVDRATEEIEHLFLLRRTFRRDIPNEDGDDFRCHDVLLRYPAAHIDGDVGGMLGLRVRIESTALERYEGQIEADRRDAVRLLAEEEQRTVISRQIKAAGEGAPNFIVRGSHFHHKELSADNDLRERKSLVKERCSALWALCANRSNEHPVLAQLVERYVKALRNLRRDRGAYRLFLSGLDLEGYVRVATSTPPDAERNPPLDGDLLRAIEALIVAHAGLLVLFPEIRRVSAELDSYRENSQAIDALRSRIFDPALARLATTTNLLDAEAASVTMAIAELGQTAGATTVLKGEQAVKHSWLRGLLAAFGQRVIAQTRVIASEARQLLIRKGVEAAWKHSDVLTGAVVRFFESARAELLTLAAKLPVSFGWLKALYDLIFPS